MTPPHWRRPPQTSWATSRRCTPSTSTSATPTRSRATPTTSTVLHPVLPPGVRHAWRGSDQSRGHLVHRFAAARRQPLRNGDAPRRQGPPGRHPDLGHRMRGRPELHIGRCDLRRRDGEYELRNDDVDAWASLRRRGVRSRRDEYRPQTVTSAQFQLTPTAGQVVFNNFVIEGFTPLPSGGFVTGKVTDLDGNPLPPIPSGAGIFAAVGRPGLSGDRDVRRPWQRLYWYITNLLTSTDASGTTTSGCRRSMESRSVHHLRRNTGGPGHHGGLPERDRAAQHRPGREPGHPPGADADVHRADRGTNGATSVLSGTIVDQNGTRSATSWPR